MRLTNNSILCDYNATAPLSTTVGRFLAQQDCDWGTNPSAYYGSGRRAHQLIRLTTEFLQQVFGLPYWVMFHSGATEGANFFFQSWARWHQLRSEKVLFVFAQTDHPCVYQLQDLLLQMGHTVYLFEVDKEGQFSLATVLAEIAWRQAQGNVHVYLNYTWVNNETGVVWDLEQALQIKQATGCFVHVDAVQAVGKIANWQRPLPGLDAYTFSGHKIGALTGVGWSFLREPQLFTPLLYGGGQQRSLRPGTENVLGIYSLQMALADLVQSWDYSALFSQQQFFEEMCGQLAHVQIVARRQLRAANTSYLLIAGRKGRDLVNFFDRAGIEVSSGAACASGSGRPGRVLLQMGYSASEALGALRFSFAPKALAPAPLSELTEKIRQLLLLHLPRD